MKYKRYLLEKNKCFSFFHFKLTDEEIGVENLQTEQKNI